MSEFVIVSEKGLPLKVSEFVIVSEKGLPLKVSEFVIVSEKGLPCSTFKSNNTQEWTWRCMCQRHCTPRHGM